MAADRVGGGRIEGFDILQRICGPENYSSIFLATSQWDACGQDKGRAREIDLRERIWADLLAKGAHLSRLKNEQSSAWALVQSILQVVPRPERNKGVLWMLGQMALDELSGKIDVRKIVGSGEGRRSID